MHKIWGSQIALPSWPHPSRWCTGQIQDATNPHKNWQERHLVGRLAEAMGEIWILVRLAAAFQYWCQNSEKWALLFYLAVNLWKMTQAIINSVGPSIAVSILHGLVHNWDTVAIRRANTDWHKTYSIHEILINIPMNFKILPKLIHIAWSFIALGLQKAWLMALKQNSWKIMALDHCGILSAADITSITFAVIVWESY